VTIDTITLVFLFAILGAMLWDMQRQNRKAHAHTQEILRDIARFLGTERR
jgi:preprotein translocase subunit YajC